jgi:hypothetical protein
MKARNDLTLPFSGSVTTAVTRGSAKTICARNSRIATAPTLSRSSQAPRWRGRYQPKWVPPLLVLRAAGSQTRDTTESTQLAAHYVPSRKHAYAQRRPLGGRMSPQHPRDRGADATTHSRGVRRATLEAWESQIGQAGGMRWMPASTKRSVSNCVPPSSWAVLFIICNPDSKGRASQNRSIVRRLRHVLHLGDPAASTPRLRSTVSSRSYRNCLGKTTRERSPARVRISSRDFSPRLETGTARNRQSAR